MRSGLRVWNWPEKWADTSHHGNKLYCAWRNYCGYICIFVE